LVFVGAYGGLRIGELARLRRTRVDLAEVQGKLHSGPPKTKASRRRVSLPGGVIEELAVHLRAPGRPTDYVFRAPAGGPPRINRFRHRVWLPATLAAGLPGLRIHDLRHTAVALWIAAGASPKEVAARAGHTSVSFVLSLSRCRCPELVLYPGGRDRFRTCGLCRVKRVRPPRLPLHHYALHRITPAQRPG
jgi:integrase